MVRRPKAFLVTLAALALAACGGGGGENVASTPPPSTSVSPTIEAAQSVKIFPNPTPTDYAVSGAWTLLSGDGVTSTSRITEISTAASEQPAIRYNAGGYYEIDLPGWDYDPLVPTSGGAPFYKPANDSRGALTISSPPGGGFQYSALASWSERDLNFGYDTLSGAFAFGSATPAGAIPLSGSASYSGITTGLTDIVDPAVGGQQYLPAFGTVTLNFDFAQSTLSGEMLLQVPDGMNPRDIGTFAFSDTVYGRGNTTFAGLFMTSGTGLNFFDGQFTGPAAQELIGRWALPFVDRGQNHQAFGAWIARRP